MFNLLKYTIRFTTWTFMWMQGLTLAALLAVILLTDMAQAERYVHSVYLPDTSLPLGTSLFFCLAFLAPPVCGLALAATQTLADAFTG